MYAGKDPFTGKQLYLRATAKNEQQAYVELGKLLDQASIGRTPETGATVERLLDQYMEIAEIDLSTSIGYQGLIRRTIIPAIGHLKLRRLRGPILDRFYAKLRRCGNVACTGKPFTEHRYVPPALNPAHGPYPFQRLAAALRTDVQTGVLAPGEKLPSVKALAAHVGVAADTVQKALNELRAEGLITGRQGSGTYVVDELPPTAAAPTTRASTKPPRPRKHRSRMNSAKARRRGRRAGRRGWWCPAPRAASETDAALA